MILLKQCVLFCLLICMTSCMIICSYTDIKGAVIKNKILLIYGLISIILNSIYYMVFEKSYTLAYLINILFLSVFSILFYVFHIWSAGDSKFLIIIMSLVPVNLYIDQQFKVNSVIVIIMVFSIAFIYVIIESIYLGIKNKNFTKLVNHKVDIANIIKQYIKCTFFILSFDLLLSYFYPQFTINNNHIILLLNMLIIMIISKFEKLNNNIIIIVMLIVILLINLTLHIPIMSDVKTSLFIVVVILLSLLSEKYNYKTISTQDVKEGMVLAQLTIYNFQLSKIRNLPHYTTEDLRTRINRDEIIAIKKWENSKYGQPKIVIIRKMPFALLISIGCILFVLLFRVLEHMSKL